MCPLLPPSSNTQLIGLSVLLHGNQPGVPIHTAHTPTAQPLGNAEMQWNATSARRKRKQLVGRLQWGIGICKATDETFPPHLRSPPHTRCTSWGPELHSNALNGHPPLSFAHAVQPPVPVSAPLVVREEGLAEAVHSPRTLCPKPTPHSTPSSCVIHSPTISAWALGRRQQRLLLRQSGLLLQ